MVHMIFISEEGAEVQVGCSLPEASLKSLWDYDKHSCREPRNVDEIHRCTPMWINSQKQSLG